MNIMMMFSYDYGINKFLLTNVYKYNKQNCVPAENFPIFRDLRAGKRMKFICS